jgi:hypothetical protein
MVDAAELSQKTQRAPQPVPYGVEETYLDVGVAVQRRNHKVFVARLIIVVDQYAHAYAAVGSAHYPTG